LPGRPDEASGATAREWGSDRHAGEGARAT